MHVKDSLHTLNDLLQAHQPRFISTLAIHSPAHWRYRPPSLNFFVFGNFRSHYKALVKTAELLAEFYLQSDFLPLIHPLTRKDWQTQIEIDGEVYRVLSKSGLLLYAVDEE